MHTRLCRNVHFVQGSYFSFGHETPQQPPITSVSQTACTLRNIYDLGANVYTRYRVRTNK